MLLIVSIWSCNSPSAVQCRNLWQPPHLLSVWAGLKTLGFSVSKSQPISILCHSDIKQILLSLQEASRGRWEDALVGKWEAALVLHRLCGYTIRLSWCPRPLLNYSSNLKCLQCILHTYNPSLSGDVKVLFRILVMWYHLAIFCSNALWISFISKH